MWQVEVRPTKPSRQRNIIKMGQETGPDLTWCNCGQEQGNDALQAAFHHDCAWMPAHNAL